MVENFPLLFMFFHGEEKFFRLRFMMKIYVRGDVGKQNMKNYEIMKLHEVNYKSLQTGKRLISFVEKLKKLF